MALSHAGQSSLIHSLAKLLRNDGDTVLAGSSTLTLQASSLQQMSRLFEQHLLSRSQQHGFLAQSSHPGETVSLLQLQFLFDMLQKTVSLKLISPMGERLQSVVKIFPFKSLKCLELKRIPPHCLEGLRGVYSQLEVFICSKSLTSLEELLSLCGGDLSSALPWLELHTLNFSYNYIVCLDQSLTLLNVLRSLDLSHNKIQECAEFLKPLSELEHLNLGYNCLQRAPTLSLSARFKLLTLILRYNELDTINGVEQLSSLQHLDLAYNVLVEHSQLAPLSMLHCLNTLNLDGNPLYFQKNHRKCTVRHLSPKAAYLRVKLDGVLLSSSELSVLPTRGQLIGQAPSSPPAAPPVAERSNNQDASSGAGELSDSMSVGEVSVTRIRKRKARSKVKVRRASISEPSDTDYEPRMRSTSCDIVLPHQKEIERMDSFREQLGEDWLRYRTQLEGPVSSVSPPPPPLPLANGHSSTQASPVPAGSHSPHAGSAQGSPAEVPEVVLPAPLLSSEPRLETSDWDADQETESTLQWTDGQGPTESTLDTSVLDSLGTAQGQGPGGESPEPEMLSETQGHRARLESGNAREEDEEEELGVDLCHPLLVGVLTEVDGGGGKLHGGGGGGRREVFLRVKQGLLLEVDMQRGLERSRLELSSLVRVQPSQAAWTHAGEEKMLPVVHLQFDYISREKRGRSYVMLDDDPQQALQALVDVLRPLVEEKRQLPGCQLHLQCLRCRSEFTLQREASEEASGGRAQRRGSLGLPEGLSEELHSEAAGMMWDQQGHHGKESSTMMCPECGSDHVVQLDSQSLAPPTTSTPNQRPSSGHQGARDDHDVVHHIPYQDHSTDNPSSRDASLGCSPVLEATITTTTTTGDPSFSSSSSFVTAQGSSFFIGEGKGDTWADRGGRSCPSKDGQTKEELSGSYKYTDASSTPPGCHHGHHGHQAAALHGGRASPGDLDLLSEDYEGVDHRLKLFLDVDVFEEEEELHSFLKMSTVKFGEPGEVPSLLVMSNQRIYFLEMTSESHGGQLSDWLQKRDSHPITDLSYLEVGLGSQSIHVEFEEGGVAYTLLVRDSARCKRYYGVLTGVVRELATKSDSKLKSISTTRLSPQHHLWPLVCEDAHTDMEEGQLQFFYLLSFLLQEDIWSPVTLLVTQETLYLLSEDHQWSKSLPSVLANEDVEPGTGGFIVLESQPISCVSSVHLWSSDPCRMDIKLYDEVVKQEKVWCVRSEGGEMTLGLLDWVRARWEAMFGVKLTTSMQDTTT